MKEMTPLQKSDATVDYYTGLIKYRFPREQSPVRIVIGIICCLTIVGIPVGIGFLIRGLRGSREFRADMHIYWAEGAELCMAWPLMVNVMLRSPGNERAPGLFIAAPKGDLTFEQATEIMAQIESVEEASTPDGEFVRGLFLNEDFVLDRRRRLPASLVGDREVYAMDLAVDTLYLVDRHIGEHAPAVLCLADKGKRGKIRAIPYWCVPGTTPPQWVDHVQPNLD